MNDDDNQQRVLLVHLKQETKKKTSFNKYGVSRQNMAVFSIVCSESTHILRTQNNKF